MNEALFKYGAWGIAVAGMAAFIMFMVKWKIKSDREAREERQEAKQERALMIEKMEKMTDKHAEVIQEISDKHNKVIQEIAGDYNKTTKENTSVISKVITLLESRPNSKR